MKEKGTTESPVSTMASSSSSVALMIDKGIMKASYIPSVGESNEKTEPFADSAAKVIVGTDQTLDEMLVELDPSKLIKECSCCNALKRHHPNSVRTAIEDRVISKALTLGKETITLLVVGSGDLKDTLSIAKKLMERGKNVNLLLVEPRIIFEIKTDFNTPSRRITDEHWDVFNKIIKRIEEQTGKTCKIAGKFGTISGIKAHIDVNAKRERNLMRASASIVQNKKVNVSKRYQILSKNADYIAGARDVFSLERSFGPGFENDFMIKPPKPDIIYAVDLGPVGDAGQSLAISCRDLAILVTVDCFDGEEPTGSVIAWKQSDDADADITILDTEELELKTESFPKCGLYK